ncbi:peptidylprolyl isomerase [Croceimicrobium sp.]|uniref:peptidylprolyl isomerase n=1 Tax=Croceimicrobium sp. TaxID=2828340 RepID=UPI003BAC4D7A
MQGDSIKEYRASYIYLNGLKLDSAQIDSLQALIILSYQEDRPFQELVEAYNMDSRGGDLGWFRAKIFVKDFVEAVDEHQKGEIFTVDIPAYHWYYVVLKTHDSRWVEE